MILIPFQPQGSMAGWAKLKLNTCRCKISFIYSYAHTTDSALNNALLVKSVGTQSGDKIGVKTTHLLAVLVIRDIVTETKSTLHWVVIGQRSNRRWPAQVSQCTLSTCYRRSTNFLDRPTVSHKKASRIADKREVLHQGEENWEEYWGLGIL